MKANEVLEGIRLGVGVAENEAELERYFVRTPTFWEVVTDDVHVILGGKGSGKTAIAKILTSRTLDIEEVRDVRVINAFSTNANKLFSAVQAKADEHTFKALWMNYFVGVVGNHVLHSSGIDDARKESIRELMQLARVPVAAKQPQAIWSDVTRGLSEPSKKKGRASARHEQRTTPRWFDPDYDFEPLLDCLIEAAEAAGVRYWVVLDRLDDAFADQPALEVPALRGLLRAFMYLLDKGPAIRVKIFLRSDVFERIVEDKGFVNLDHIILLSAKLAWRHEEIAQVIASRVATSPAFPELAVHSGDTREILHRVLPEQVSYFTGRRHQTHETLTWCIGATEARHGEPSPRNILDLLREARRSALARAHAMNIEYEKTAPLITFKELQDAWATVSQSRLDGLYGENHDIRAWVESLRGQSAVATRETFRSRCRSANPLADPDLGIRELLKAGVVYSPTADSLEVIPLYVPALDIGKTGYRDDQYIVLSEALDNPDHVRDRAKELSRGGNREAAVNLLTTAHEVPLKNAVLAANVAIESRDQNLLRTVDSFLARRTEFSERLIGKRMVIRYAMNDIPGAERLAEGLGEAPGIFRIYGDFVGGLTSDLELEYVVWRHICHRAAGQARPWDAWGPVVAAMRVLAVARNRSAGREAFDRVKQSVVHDWFPKPTDDAARSISVFLERYANGESELVAQFYPYQIVSARFVRSQLGLDSPTIDSLLERALASRLSSEDDEKQSHFRDWTTYDEFAARVFDRIGRVEEGQ